MNSPSVFPRLGVLEECGKMATNQMTCTMLMSRPHQKKNWDNDVCVHMHRIMHVPERSSQLVWAVVQKL